MYRLALTLALILPAAADEVILTDGSRLSGTVAAVADTGELALASPLSSEPFQLRADHIKQVQFSHAKKVVDEYDAMLVLANGDELPCDLLGINADSLRVNTSLGGEIDVPRSAVNTVQLGVRPRKLVYRGPDSDDGWKIKSGWRFDNRRFMADGSGTLARSFDIPGSFALRFRLAWKNTPNIQVYFADDMLETTGKADRYYVTFNSSGFELKRQQSNDGHPYLAMASIPREPDDFPDSQLEVELRVDRKLAMVHVYLNGEFVEKYHDSLDSAPIGQGVMFRSNTGGEDLQFIDAVEVREWDPSADRHRAEPRGDESSDVVITRSSDRGKVKILEMRELNGTPMLFYKGPHSPTAVELPLDEVSTLFFERPAERPAQPHPPLALGLRSRGSLGVNNCRSEGDLLIADHPLLGKLSIRRDAVAKLERIDGKEEQKDVEEEEEE
ncbi:hypothetical protein [Luteolibacter luteus]|uniref:Uncharacterized protein n=1 Tax=Luteolibacter luteus TaxID=2728835 RepID=A0A858RCT6_9BACT|nr:hypothetical protein [Luteolibacter luteus]QJE94607.1 hypothetical protein HHL09_02015 [Luteolibacter luteus]